MSTVVDFRQRFQSSIHNRLKNKEMPFSGESHLLTRAPRAPFKESELLIRRISFSFLSGLGFFSRNSGVGGGNTIKLRGCAKSHLLVEQLNQLLRVSFLGPTPNQNHYKIIKILKLRSETVLPTGRAPPWWTYRRRFICDQIYVPSLSNPNKLHEVTQPVAIV